MKWPRYPSPFESEKMFRELPKHSSLPSVTISAFTRYKTEVAELPANEGKKVDAIGDGIIASYRPGRCRIIGALITGHADRDIARGPAFEHKISVERADKVREAVLSAIQKKSPNCFAPQVGEVVLRSIGVGATEPIVAFPRDEAQRARNRRVTVYLAEALKEFWTFWTISRQRYQPELTSLATDASIPRTSGVKGGIPFFINPDVFDFKPDPSVSNWQVTSCVAIIFGYGVTFMPRLEIKVGVVVGAPLELRDGKKLSVREAQLDSALAAEAAATIIKGMLDAGSIGLSEVQPRFVGFMGGAIMSTGLGYRVRGCHPKTAA